MHYDLTIQDYIRIFRKRFWIIVCLPILAGLIAYSLIPVPEPSFQAWGRIQVSKRTPTTESGLVGSRSYELGNYLQTQAEIVTGQDVMKEVGRRLGRIPETASDEAILENRSYFRVLMDLSSSVAAEPVQWTSLLAVTAERDDPDEVVSIVNTVMDVYVEQHTYRLNQEVIESRRHIAQQLEHYRQALKQAEDALSAFNLENAATVSLSSGEHAQTQEELEGVETDITAIGVQIDLIDDNLDPSSVMRLGFLSRLSLREPGVQSLLDALLRLRQEREQLLLYQTLRSPEVQRLDQKLSVSLSVLRAELVGVRARLIADRDRLDGKLRALPSHDVQRGRMEREVEVNEQMYLLLNAEDQRASIREAGTVPEVSVVERPVLASGTARTGRRIKVLVALALGLLMGAVVALIAESLDTSLGAIEEVESLLEVPVIGVIPPFDLQTSRKRLAEVVPRAGAGSRNFPELASLVAHSDPNGPVAEAYRAIRTTIREKLPNDEGKIIVVTSAVLGEGKSATVANLAVVFAQMGHKTLVVGADLRRPNVEKCFGLDNDRGLINVLSMGMPLADAVQRITDIVLGDLGMDGVLLTPGLDNLFVLPSSSRRTNGRIATASGPMRAGSG